MIQNPRFRLFLWGLTILFWELVLIRWLSGSVRIIGYFTNFVLIGAFFGLGAGALLTRFEVKLERWIAPLLALCVVPALYWGAVVDVKSLGDTELIWRGVPLGFRPGAAMPRVDMSLLLTFFYLAVATAFGAFGQTIGKQFRTLPALSAYSWEISGSVVGIWAFALLSYLRVSPFLWMLLGFGLLVAALEKDKLAYLLLLAAVILVSITVAPEAGRFIWSPYYKIRFEPLSRIFDRNGTQLASFDKPYGYSLEVNNDYHQMILDLAKGGAEHPFFDQWRRLYNAPYLLDPTLPAGPILIVGAGTGNDVSAALRSTGRDVYAVEIDPEILDLGRQNHPEHPYANSRVHIVQDDARSFFQKTDQRFALVVFGFLDSHTLMSSFSSLRLDNFVYTQESLRRVKEILLPGGQVTVTFATNTQWLNDRFKSLLTNVYDAGTQTMGGGDGMFYANGLVYRNFKAPLPAGIAPKGNPGETALIPTDNWPFLYLREPGISAHYGIFLAIILLLSFPPLLFLPKGTRTIRLPYYFLGAAFFLLETGNVVSLSLLFGSTWIVNAVVFSGILLLILLSNQFAFRFGRARLDLLFAALALALAVAHFVPTASLLGIDSRLVRAVIAVAVYLGPVFFAGVIFAKLILGEENLFQAYGSNLLGAVMGGALEYSSLLFGFKMLYAFALLLYLLAFLFLRQEGSRGSA